MIGSIIEAILTFLTALIGQYNQGLLTRDKALAAADAAAAALKDPGPPS